MKILVISFSIVLFLCLPGIVNAQGDPHIELKNAVDNYEKGQFQQAVEYLSTHYNDKQYTTAEQQQAYKVLISSYHELDEIEKEMEFTRKFIKLDPIYTISYSSDPAPFVNAIEKFDISPRWSIRFGLFGLNLMSPKVEQTYNVWDINDLKSSYSHGSSVTIINPEIVFHFNDKYSIYSGVNLNFYGYGRKIRAQNSFSENYSETIVEIKVPLMFCYKYQLTKKTAVSGLIGGYVSNVGGSATIVASGKVSTTGYSTFNKIGDFNKSADISLADTRNNTNYGGTFGFSAEYKPSRWSYSLTLTHSNDFRRYTKPLKYPLNTLTTDFYYVDDDLKLANWCLTLGVSYDLSFIIKQKY